MLVLVAPRKDDFPSPTSAIRSSIGTPASAVKVHSSTAWRAQIAAIVATRIVCSSIKGCSDAGSFSAARFADV